MKYFITYTGVKFYPETSGVEDINLIDIAHHLTNINRFAGTLDFRYHYSVAEHSIILAEHLYGLNYDRTAVLGALLHDASEAYLGDVVTGLKPFLKDYKKLENRIQNLIYSKYVPKMDAGTKKLVKSFDKRVILDEILTYCPHRFEMFLSEYTHVTPLGVSSKLNQMNKQQVFDKFFRILNSYGVKDESL